MNEPERFRRVAEVFEAARARDGADREAFLQDACADDPHVLAEVRRLLAHHDGEEGVLDAPIVPGAVHADVHRAPTSPPLPTRVGRYRVKRQLGLGGMGIVYLAEQDKPRREVAIKVIRPRLVSRELLKRFDLEAAMLGRLQHPGIAQIYEAGTHDDGSGARPYFAMEYVDGSPLLRFARERALDVRGRLEVFASICDAVEHAHQRSIIHRDLKPGNVLVERSGQPKILDFGIARATDADLQVSTLQTSAGQLMGTVAYMSPEQASGRLSDIDTRSDVYALGVMLYELISDRLPHDLSDRTIAAATRIISEQDPTPLTSLSREYRGDLSTIVHKALEKDPERRYQSASVLAADIRHFLNDEPIVARPATTIYQLSKFARRNKGLVGGLAATFVVLVVGVVVAATLAIKADRAREEAITRAEQLAQVASFQTAQLSEIDAHTMGAGMRADILAQVASTLPTAEPRPSEVERRLDDFARVLETVNFTDLALASLEVNVFDRALRAVESQFDDQPLVKAQLLQSMASTMRDLGLLDGAMAPQQGALAIRQQVAGSEAVETIDSLNATGLLLKKRGRLEEAEPYYREALAMSRRLLGETHAKTVVSLINLGLLLKTRGDSAGAEACLVEALATSSRALGDDHPRTLTARNSLGAVLEVDGRLAEAHVHYVAALEGRRRTLGDDHPSTLRSVSNVGNLLIRQDRLEEAEAYCAEALRERRRVLGNTHPDTLISVSNMGGLRRRQRRLDEASVYYLEALDARRRLLGHDHPSTLISLANLARLNVLLGELETAEQQHRQAWQGRQRVLGREHAYTLDSARHLGSVLAERGEFIESETLLLEAFEGYQRKRGDTASDTLDVAGRLAELYERWHEAEPDAARSRQAAEWRARSEE